MKDIKEEAGPYLSVIIQPSLRALRKNYPPTVFVCVQGEGVESG